MAKLNNRYELKDVLGRGAMGVVYSAEDTVLNRIVAIKTIRDVQNEEAVDLFRKECAVLASITHPNVIEIFDIGEILFEGGSKPYFAMPLLRGETLDKVIRNASRRLTIERTADIIAQTCRGLQAAHDRGLVHRDLKPSNIFLADDDTVKIIDFGVAHLMEHHSSIGLKGTLMYMAPEQILMKGSSPLSDVFSLGVLTYEMVTGRLPFTGPSESEIVQAIIYQSPPLASELNSAANQTVAQVIHKAMAKQPVHRFQSAREYAETLLKAVRSEPIERFNPSRVEPRVQSARKALSRGDVDLAADILAEIEAEGHMHAELVPMRRDIDRQLRERNIGKLLGSAQRRMAEQEFNLALNKVQEVLSIDPANEEALRLKQQIDGSHVERQIAEWLLEANENIARADWEGARQAIAKVLNLRPGDAQAGSMLADVDRQSEEQRRIREEREPLYESAVSALERGEVDRALQHMERVIQMDRLVGSSADRAKTHLEFYEQLRTEHDRLSRVYVEAQRQAAEGNIQGAIGICKKCLAKHPKHEQFLTLKADLEQRLLLLQQPPPSAFLAEVRRQVEAEPELDRRIEIVERAIASNPRETRLERALLVLQEQRARTQLSFSGMPITETTVGSLTGILGAPAVGSATQRSPVMSNGPAIMLEPLVPVAAPPLPPPPERNWGRSITIGAALGIVIFGALIAGNWLRQRRPPAPPPKPIATLVPVSVHLDPPGALISVDGDLQGDLTKPLQLKPGKHSVTASMEGYEPVNRNFDVKSPGSALAIALRPMSQILRVSSDLEGATATLDGKPVAEVTSGQFTLRNLGSEQHTLLVAGRYGAKAVFKFQSSTGSIPVLVAPPVVENLKAVIVGSSGGRARIYTVFGPGKVDVSIDGKVVGSPPPDGLEVANLNAGNLMLKVFDGKSARDFPVEVGASSALAILLNSDRNVGSLLVDAGQEDARVLVDGQERKGAKQRGQVFLANLDAKVHVIQVEKAGFKSDPEKQSVTILKGESVRVKFDLKPSAILAIRGSIPGADVSLDGRKVGQVAADGSFSISLEPGKHEIELSRKGYRFRPMLTVAKQGETVALAVAEVSGEKLASLSVSVTPGPPASRVTIHRADGSEIPFADKMEVGEGDYTIRATADGYVSTTKQIYVKGGATEAIHIPLALNDSGRVKDPPLVVPGWDKADDWKPEDGWLVHRGADLVFFKQTLAGGRWTFTIRCKGGSLRGCNPRFFIHFQDMANQLRYDVEKSYLTRTQIKMGKTIAGPKIAHGGSGRDGSFTFQVAVTPQRATVSIFNGSAWSVLDDFPADGENLTEGRFGFSGRELYLSNFRFER